MKGDKILFFLGPLNFAKKEIYCILNHCHVSFARDVKQKETPVARVVKGINLSAILSS